ncbi:MAG: DUF6314 family protein [Chlamydiota bacterium]
MDIKKLVGAWQLWRTICDGKTGKISAMWGKGTFSPSSKGELTYFEEVSHWTAAKTLHRATKMYGYRLTKSAFEIYSRDTAEERLFLTLSIHRERLEGQATCGCDCYRLQWRWQNANAFWQRYCIVGPRKNCVITSIFSR